MQTHRGLSTIVAVLLGHTHVYLYILFSRNDQMVASILPSSRRGI